MPLIYPELNNETCVVTTTLDQSLEAQLSVLGDDPGSYFDLSVEHQMIDVANLIAIRARPNGIVNANKLMKLARIGEGSKRKPILVRPFDHNRWLVVDGNSTTINAIFSGWHYLPCTLE